ALCSNGIEHDAEMLGLELTKRIAQSLQETSAVAAGANHSDDSVHSRCQRHCLGDEQQRTRIEDHVIVFLQRLVDEIDQQLALEQFGCVARLGAGGQHVEVRDLCLLHRRLEVV